MRVFISSVIRGMEPHRAAVSDAVASLGYAVIRSEEFGPSTDTPRRACLQAARTADLGPSCFWAAQTYGFWERPTANRRVQVSRQRMKSFARLATTAR